MNAIKQNNGCWRVHIVCLEHNHDLDPSMSIFMDNHPGLSINIRRQLETKNILVLCPCKSIRILEVHLGGPQELGCSGKDCRNYIEHGRKLRLGVGDAETIRKPFMMLQKNDKNFFHFMDIDDDSKLRNVMCIHRRSIVTYEEFHDVLTFDISDLVNRYNIFFFAIR